MNLSLTSVNSPLYVAGSFSDAPLSQETLGNLSSKKGIVQTNLVQRIARADSTVHPGFCQQHEEESIISQNITLMDIDSHDTCFTLHLTTI